MSSGGGIWMLAAEEVRVTRGAAAGPWEPTDLASLAAWWDFSDAATLFTDAGVTLVNADGQSIYQVNDKSGNGRHFVQASVGARPTYKTGIINGLSVARLDGSGDTMAWSGSSFDIAAAAAATNFSAAMFGGYNALLTSGAAGSPRGYFQGTSGGTNWYSDANTPFNGVMRNNGVLTDSFAPLPTFKAATGNRAAALSVTSLLMGDDTAATTRYWSGDVGEIILVAAQLSTMDYNLLGNYLADKWAFSWTDIS